MPVPGAVTLEWLGFPRGEWSTIAEAFHNVAAYTRATPNTRPRSERSAG